MMNGKVLKVVEYNLTFGTNARMVNVFGVIRYKKNNNLYVIYADIGNQYNVVNYGGSHIKGNSILSIGCKNEDVEIIKEYIFKVTNGEELSDFESISLDDIDGIEIISSNHLELKPDVIQQLVDKTIPKPKVVDEVETKPVNKKKSSKFLVVLILLIALALGAYYVYTSYFSDIDKADKVVICTLSEIDRTLNANKNEEKVLSFNYKDVLQHIKTTTVFAFNTEEGYQDFINKGTMYKYMPEDETQGGFKQDDEAMSFTIIKEEDITSSYEKSVNYEDVILENRDDGYNCEEKILGE